MDLHQQLAELKPTSKKLVFDLVESAGFDVSDWIGSASRPHMAKANPKYCYEWSLVQPGEVAIFNLWHDIMEVSDGHIVYRENFRAHADFHRKNGGKQQWISRGKKLDHAVAAAAKHWLPVRVIVLDGERRNTKDPASRSSKVQYRELDIEQWHVKRYDRTTGDFILARGPAQSAFVDQFHAFDAQRQDRVEVVVDKFVRNANVRRSVLARAKGRCEFCDEQGFVTPSGAIYLETHHIVPLAEGGPDTVKNVVALCANDHARAHFSLEGDPMRIKLVRVTGDQQA